MKVILETAFRWVCPDCGHENFHCGNKVPEDDAEEIKEQFAEMCDQEWAGDVVAAPAFVFCRKCEGRFDCED